MSAHEGVSCDACGKSNFGSKRFKCLICYDYDLCSTCYDKSESSSHHTPEHPMQCILTQQDFDLYYHGEKYSYDQPQSLTCPLCGEMGLEFPFMNDWMSSNNVDSRSTDLFQHLHNKHAECQQTHDVICPVCAAMANGDSNFVTRDLVSHIANDHQYSQANTPSTASEETNGYSRQSLLIREYDLNSGVLNRGGRILRRGSSRIPSRRGTSGLGRGSGLSTYHFLGDNSSTAGNGNDPIVDLLTQLSTVRRLVQNTNGATTSSTTTNNNNNSLTSSSNQISLQTITRQQYERERLRTLNRLHQQSSNTQQTMPTTNLISPFENDFFDGILPSVLIDPVVPSAGNNQSSLLVNGQQQQISDPFSQTSSTPKPSTTTTVPSLNREYDPSLLKQICNESFSTPAFSKSIDTLAKGLKHRSDFVQNLLLLSFGYSIND